MRSAFRIKLDALDSDSKRLQRLNSAVKRSLSVVAPAKQCLECGGRLVARKGVFYKHDLEEGAAIKERVDKMVDSSYFTCDNCNRSFTAAAQFGPEFIRAVELARYMLVTADGDFISMVRSRPFR